MTPKADAFLAALRALCVAHQMALLVVSYEPVFLKDLAPDESPLDLDQWQDATEDDPAGNPQPGR